MDNLLYTFNEIFITGNMKDSKDYLYRYKDSNLFIFLVFVIDTILRGIAQVFLCDHPITGLFICIALCITSYELMLFALLGTFFGTFGAYFIGGIDLQNIHSGLCGYDSFLYIYIYF